MIINCVKDYLIENVDDILLYCEQSDVLDFSRVGQNIKYCRVSFYNPFVRVGVLQGYVYNHVIDIYYNDPNMLSILKDHVCDILKLTGTEHA